ncbi:uncharacterized protein LTR77_008171 [Saxophila tyrrhenica]|uniref:Uncharacterized protein n=1 Tax=Saxophila tyrrhenica TaxID=1690608 RepID=A0AAV9P2T4_9PEZI|nr:hypothetical protein LTR77_008171 [Saxophila tyrrhenica]
MLVLTWGDRSRPTSATPASSPTEEGMEVQEGMGYQQHQQQQVAAQLVLYQQHQHQEQQQQSQAQHPQQQIHQPVAYNPQRDTAPLASVTEESEHEELDGEIDRLSGLPFWYGLDGVAAREPGNQRQGPQKRIE